MWSTEPDGRVLRKGASSTSRWNAWVTSKPSALETLPSGRLVDAGEVSPVAFGDGRLQDATAREETRSRTIDLPGTVL
jgi:hypothetical protein